MSKKVIYEVTLVHLVRETATFYVELDESVDPDMVDTEQLADAVYEAEAGEAARLWQPDQEFGAEKGSCSAERYTDSKRVKTIATVRDTDCYLEARFTE